MQDMDFDLFGLPVEPGTGKPGRPKKVATAEDRNKIRLLLACGWSNERMARAVDMSLPTFRRNFFQELRARDAMRDRLDARRLEVVARLALEGANVGAIKELGKMLEKSDLMGAERRMREAQNSDRDQPDRAKSKVEADPRLGKKEAASAAAKTAGQGSDWGSDLLPGVVN